MKRQQMVARSAFDPELPPFQNNGSQEHLARANSDAVSNDILRRIVGDSVLLVASLEQSPS